MRIRIPTDRFGRAFNVTKTSPPIIDYSDAFIDADGDKMEGELDMGKNKITNIAHPTTKFDCANKAYVDEIKKKTLIALRTGLSMVESVSKNNLKMVKTISESNDIFVKRCKIVNVAHVPQRLFKFPGGASLDKNIIILQVMLKSKEKRKVHNWVLAWHTEWLHLFQVNRKTEKKEKQYGLALALPKQLPDRVDLNLMIIFKVLSNEYKKL